MKIFDSGQRAIGFIALGQEATGVIAIGQAATGIIAIGQVARGVFAVGQGAFGLVGWGQAGAGVFHAAGMIGVGGRRGIGAVLPLVPSLGRPRVMPEATVLAAIEAGQEGWIDADLTQQMTLGVNGAPLPIKMDRRLQKRAQEITAEGPRRVRAYVRRISGVLVCERIAHEPPRPYEKKGFWTLSAFQVAGLFVLGALYAGIVGHDLVIGLGKVFDDKADTRSPSPAPPVRPKRGR
jgi:hypothetical protein